MQTSRTLLLIGMLFCLPMLSLSAAHAAGPEAVDTAVQKPPRQLRPIERAYERIRIGMTEKELLALMAPFEVSNEPPAPWGRFLWQTWTDGQISISVGRKEGWFMPLMDDPPPVGEKHMYKRVFVAGEIKWVLVAEQPQEPHLVFRPGGKASK
jgi:hypothetical protein